MKEKFPFLNNTELHYLDSAATSHKPKEVIDKIYEYYSFKNANPGRGSYDISIKNEQIVKEARDKVAKFVGVKDSDQIIFTKGSTESLNLIAFGYALNNLEKDDEIILAISNHHANIVPWLEVSKIKNFKIKYVYLDENGDIDLKELVYLINDKTKIISISSVSNVTGIIHSFEKISNIAKRNNIVFVLDCAQSISHFKHEFEKWDIDFAVFSGHKMYAAQGIGILYGKKELLSKTKPLLYGGDMVETVEKYSASYKEAPSKFEGGTLNVAGILSLSKAIDFIDYEKFSIKKEELLIYAMYKLSSLDFVEIYYLGISERISLFAFNVIGVHSHDVSYILDTYNVAIRAGKHCAFPLHDYMGINSSCRVSLDIYNSKEDIDKLVEALLKVKEIFISKESLI